MNSTVCNCLGIKKSAIEFNEVHYSIVTTTILQFFQAIENGATHVRKSDESSRPVYSIFNTKSKTKHSYSIKIQNGFGELIYVLDIRNGTIYVSYIKKQYNPISITKLDKVTNSNVVKWLETFAGDEVNAVDHTNDTDNIDSTDDINDSSDNSDNSDSSGNDNITDTNTFIDSGMYSEKENEVHTFGYILTIAILGIVGIVFYTIAYVGIMDEITTTIVSVLIIIAVYAFITISALRDISGERRKYGAVQ